MSTRQLCLIDCGSSAVRAYIAEIGPGRTSRVLQDLSRDIDLIAGLHGGRFSRETMDAVVHAVADIMAEARGYGVEEVRAVATAAMREASNSDVLVERLQVQCGLEIEIIDSAEETRLYYAALRRLLEHTGDRLPGASLLMNVGSGTTAVGLIKSGKLVHAVDEHFGTERLLGAFASLREGGDFAQAVDRVTVGAVSMILSRLPRARVRHLVVTGNEVRQLQRLLRPGDDQPLAPMTLTDLDRWWAAVAELNPTTRAAACRCSTHDAALLLLSAALLRNLLRHIGAEALVVPQLRLRDGLLADSLPGAQGPHHLSRSQLLAAAKELARRYGMDLKYAENTAALARQIFDQTAELHHLGERERTLLEFAAWVHDVGACINVRSRHKHSYYILGAIDLAGLSEEEQQVVAHVARYHRRSTPKPGHIAFQRLPRQTRVVISHLAAILRIAYALDVERTQRIRTVHCSVSGSRLVVRVDRREIALERWAVRDKSAMFADVFGLDVVLDPREED